MFTQPSGLVELTVSNPWLDADQPVLAEMQSPEIAEAAVKVEPTPEEPSSEQVSDEYSRPVERVAEIPWQDPDQPPLAEVELTESVKSVAVVAGVEPVAQPVSRDLADLYQAVTIEPLIRRVDILHNQVAISPADVASPSGVNAPGTAGVSQQFVEWNRVSLSSTEMTLQQEPETTPSPGDSGNETVSSIDQPLQPTEPVQAEIPREIEETAQPEPALADTGQPFARAVEIMPNLVAEQKYQRDEPVSAPVMEPEEGVRRLVGTQDNGTVWIDEQPRGNYTLQLISDKRLSFAENYLKGIESDWPAAIFSFNHSSGNPWFGVIIGSFSGYSVAKKAAADYSEKVGGGTPWIRDFDDVRQAMRK